MNLGELIKKNFQGIVIVLRLSNGQNIEGNIAGGDDKTVNIIDKEGLLSVVLIDEIIAISLVNEADQT